MLFIYNYAADNISDVTENVMNQSKGSNQYSIAQNMKKGSFDII